MVDQKTFKQMMEEVLDPDVFLSFRSMIMHINGEQKLSHTGLTGTIQAKPDLDITISGKIMV